MSKVVDSKLQKALKSLLSTRAPALESTLGSKANEITSQLGDQSYVAAAKAALLYAGMTRFEKSSEESLADALARLKSAGLSKSAEYLAINQCEQLAALDPLEIIRCAPSAKAIQTLCKKKKNLPQALEKLVLGSSDFITEPVVVEWLVARAPTKTIGTMAALIIRFVEGDRIDPSAIKIIALAIARDKSGNVLSELLSATAKHKTPFSAVISALASDHKALASAISVLPKVALGTAGPLIPEVAPNFVPLLGELPPKRRLAVSRIIMAVMSSLLAAASRKPAARATATSICSWSVALETQGAELGDLILPRATGSINSSGNEADRLSPKMSAMLGDTLEKLRKGFEPSSLIEALVINLGLEFLHEQSDIVEYDFRIHQDTVGGLVAGDKAEVIHPGLKSGAQIVLKSSVKPAQT
jgi:hypothetical protein